MVNGLKSELGDAAPEDGLDERLRYTLPGWGCLVGRGNSLVGEGRDELRNVDSDDVVEIEGILEVELVNEGGSARCETTVKVG